MSNEDYQKRVYLCLEICRKIFDIFKENNLSIYECFRVSEFIKDQLESIRDNSQILMTINDFVARNEETDK